MIKVFHPRGVRELFWKAGRTTEKTAFKRLIKKSPTQAIKAHKLAQLKGVKKVQALGKRHGVEGLGIFTKGRKIKPSKARPFHRRGKDYPDLADDPTVGGVKAYADMPSIKRRASTEASFTKHSWGFAAKPKPELAAELHAGKKHFGRIYSKPGSKAYKKLFKK